jgi:hypothetical protein
VSEIQKEQSHDQRILGWIVFLFLFFAAVVLYFRFTLASPLRQVFVALFTLDISHGVFWGSLLVTFVASVMGKDQEQRLSQGKFGLAAGTTLGGLSGLLEKQPELVVVGFVGSAVGGLAGWVFYLLLASLVVRFPQLKSLVVFQAGGLEVLQKHLDVASKENLRLGFDAWTEKFSRMISDAKDSLACADQGPQWEEQATATIQMWLTAAVDTLALVFGTLSDKPQYQSRVTLIVYRVGTLAEKPEALGKHWISYAGQLKPHSKDQLFDASSVGYKVLEQELASPYFTTQELAQKEGQARTGDPSYRPFITFRLNGSAILALDWPGELTQEDAYVQAARSLFYSTVAPAITELIRVWPTPLADAAHLPKLRPEDPAQGTTGLSLTAAGPLTPQPSNVPPTSN